MYILYSGLNVDIVDISSPDDTDLLTSYEDIVLLRPDPLPSLSCPSPDLLYIYCAPPPLLPCFSATTLDPFRIQPMFCPTFHRDPKLLPPITPCSHPRSRLLDRLASSRSRMHAPFPLPHSLRPLAILPSSPVTPIQNPDLHPHTSAPHLYPGPLPTLRCPCVRLFFTSTTLTSYIMPPPSPSWHHLRHIRSSSSDIHDPQHRGRHPSSRPSLHLHRDHAVVFVAFHPRPPSHVTQCSSDLVGTFVVSALLPHSLRRIRPSSL